MTNFNPPTPPTSHPPPLYIRAGGKPGGKSGAEKKRRVSAKVTASWNL